ncbi:hypothetical protein LWI29_009473 [Acer saccharum]|uniref:Uncharacterized protein n=1 Tax=Acer saccharum TaxID=4024 RepID=A0AA39RIZ2_ACESA|nr:hypothetical protein LWI29_009473 [Acer saccharum]
MEPPSNASGLRRRCSGAPSEMEPSSIRSNSDEVVHHHRQMKRPPFDAGKPPRLTTEGYHNYHHQIPCRIASLDVDSAEIRLGNFYLWISVSLFDRGDKREQGLDASFNADGDEAMVTRITKARRTTTRTTTTSCFSFLSLFLVCLVCVSSRVWMLRSMPMATATGRGNGDEDNEDQENDDKDNDDLVLLLTLSISGLLLFGFAISHGAEFRRLGLCFTVSLRQQQRQRGFGLGLRVIT